MTTTKRLIAVSLLLLLPACQQKMARQPSYRPLEASEFFGDGRSAQPPVPGTVARSQLRTDTVFYTGLKPGQADAGPRQPGGTARPERDFVDTFPFEITAADLKRGQERYMIYCVVCHDPVGTGRGKIVERGYTQPPSYHEPRLRAAPAGHFFDVITHGLGSMPDHAAQVPPRDRWSIVAYIRALQLSQHARLTDLPADVRQRYATGGHRP